MACLNDKPIRRSDVTAGRQRLLRRINAAGAASTAELTGRFTSAAATRRELRWLLEHHLVAPVAAYQTRRVDTDGRVTATARDHRGRSASTSTFVTSSYRSTPRSVAGDDLYWMLTRNGSDIAFNGIRFRGSMAIPDRGRHWLCPRGTRARTVAVERLQRYEAPIDGPGELDEVVDEFLFALTAEFDETDAYHQLRQPLRSLDGFSIAEQIRCGDAGIERAARALIDTLLDAAGRRFEGPRGEQRARTADPLYVSIARNGNSWGYRHGFADSLRGRMAFCCTSRGDHDHLDLPGRLAAAGLYQPEDRRAGASR